MTTYHPPQCSEREPDGTWEDCLWCSLVMLANAAYAASHYPSTQAEYEALRKASGDTMVGGSNMGDGIKGMDARYGWHGVHHAFGPDAVTSLPIGSAIALTGSMGRVGSHLRRWDPTFTGAHSVCVVRDQASGYWWMNPQAPPSYPGEYVTLNTLVAYAGGVPGGGAMTVRVGERATAPAPQPTRFRVVMTGYTPLFVAPNGKRLPALYHASVLATRRLVGGQWWYRIASRADGTKARTAGQWFKPNARTHVQRAAG